MNQVTDVKYYKYKCENIKMASTTFGGMHCIVLMGQRYQIIIIETVCRNVYTSVIGSLLKHLPNNVFE